MTVDEKGPPENLDPSHDSARPAPFDRVLSSALDEWRGRQRLSDLAAPIVEWMRSIVRAERFFLFNLSDDGAYRFRSSHNIDGETILDPEQWISHFAVGRARAADETVFFVDTRQDRRFRTEGERVAGTKTRSILVIPLVGEHVQAMIYFDARFAPIEWPPGAEPSGQCGPSHWKLALDLLHLAFAKDGLERECQTVNRQLKRLKDRQKRIARPARPQVRVGGASPREVEFGGFLTRCPVLIAEFDEIRRLAGSRLPMLIEGESGTGKEVLARAIHELSGRRGPFVSIHCGAIPSSLVEIELFGHARGAFTGAEKPRRGLFALAQGGTLFLDDVGEMPLEMQNALLRVLESGTYRPVSGMEEQVTDARILASALVGSEGEHTTTSLRHDLFYRLAGARFLIPPLRARGEDIPLLARRFLEKHA